MHNPTVYQGSDNKTALIAASTVKGTSVYGASGDKLGSIDDVMLGKRDGTVAYAIMSFGGFLGIGEKYHPLPWDMLDYDTSLGGYRVSLTEEQLKDAPNYGRDEFSSSNWDRATDDHYGTGTYAGGTSAYGARTASAM